MKPEEIDAIHPFGLSNRADCAGPDSDTSPGAQWLRLVAGYLVEHVEAGYDIDEDFVHEAADSLVPTSTHERWLVFVDVAGYDEDTTELGCDGSDLTQAAGVALYMIAERLLYALVEELGDDEAAE